MSSIINEKKEKIILGIDPGTRIMGYGIIKIHGNKPILIAMGVIDIRSTSNIYLRLGHVFNRIIGVIDSYLPDELAIEAPFYGKNVQSMLKLGRAQGVAIAAAITRDIPICEYEPRKIKMAITGSGNASKEQVAGMLQRLLKISPSNMSGQLDATDALAVAYCHYLQSNVPHIENHIKSWNEYIKKNGDKVHN